MDKCDIILTIKMYLICFYKGEIFAMETNFGVGNVVHISNIYSCTQLETPSEMYYIAELSKYLNERGKYLSIEGVVIPENYKDTFFYKYLKSANVIGVEYEELEQQDARKYFRGSLSNKTIDINCESNIEWVFDFDGSSSEKNNYVVFKGLLSSQIYLSFVAMITIKKMFDGSPSLLKFDFRKANVCLVKDYSNWEFLDLWLVFRKTRALSNWISFMLPESNTAEPQLNYEAYFHELRLLGCAKDYAPVADKIAYYRRNFRVNDIVLLYTKVDTGSEKDPIKLIDNCQISRIESATREGLTLTVYNVHDTPISTKLYIEGLPEKVRELYGEDYYKKYNAQSTMICWSDLGIGDLTYAESKFITDLNCDDRAVLAFEKNGEVIELELENADAVYAILCERGIDFNKKRFEQLYFSTNPSIYKREILGE